ncbi:MAG: helix-turn-helix domain-containing protein [Nitrococcus sp.]|nr:helix-turn-helix domain-containing protein [Nitrococcus sp.]
MVESKPALYGVPEAGRRLGVSASTVWRMIRRGRLPSVLENGRRLVPGEALTMHARNEDGDQIPALDENHPIFRLVGAGKGGGQAPGAREKHSLLD